MATEDPTPLANVLADPSTRRALEDFVRRRVPAPDVEDVVQTVLCDALAAEGRPERPEEVRRWLIGIARHKVADLHRRGSREQASELPELPAPPPPIEARELARWAEEQAASTRDAKQTLAWMAREGEGEKLESIAAEEQVPAARVRQRVSRMRRWMKERWLAELAAVAALAIAALLLSRWLRGPKDEIAPRPEPPPPPSALPEAPSPRSPLSPLDRARALRAEAFQECDRAAWERCLERLDEAAALDPAGDTAKDVVDARGRARRAIEEQQRLNEGPKDAPRVDSKNAESITPAPTSIPTSSAAPKPAPRPTATPPTKGKPPAFSKKSEVTGGDFSSEK